MKERMLVQLRNLMQAISPGQLAFFHRIYPNSIDAMNISQIKTAISQCERSFQSNEKNRKTLDELLTQYPNKLEDFKKQFPDYTDDSVVDETMLKNYSQWLTYVAPVVVVKLPITHGHEKTPKETQLIHPKFKNQEEADEYFSDSVSELIQCGQGHYQDEAEAFCYIDDVFFLATIKAEIGRQSCERGDKLYYVEKLESVSYQKYSEEVERENIKKEKQAKLTALKAQVARLEAELA